jgi:hypothetical protein
MVFLCDLCALCERQIFFKYFSFPAKPEQMNIVLLCVLADSVVNQL